MSDLDSKANTSDVLTLEEIQASTDLSGKIASASALSIGLGKKANSVFIVEYIGTNENKTFDLLNSFGDKRGIYLISSASDYYGASYGVWVVGLSKSTNQNFVHMITGKTASLTINSDYTFTFNANYGNKQIYSISAIKLA